MKPTMPVLFLLLLTGCSSSFYKEAGKSAAIAAAYEQSDEKQRGMTQRDYEEHVRVNISTSRTTTP